jgi:hypothetical protein
MGETDGILEQYAALLEHKASRAVRRFAVCLGVVGAALGGFPVVHTGNAVVPPPLGFLTLLLGAAAGGYLGHTLGGRRALELRLQARLALHQLALEQSLLARLAPPARPVVAPAPAPVPAAAPAPAPVAVPAPPPAVAPAVAPPAVAPPIVQPVVAVPPPPPPAPAPAPLPVPPAAVAAPPLSST